MKKLFTVIVLLFICIGSFANFEQYNITQNNWRWRNSDGSEASASWKANQNKPIKYGSAKEVLRLRVEIINYSTTSRCSYDPCPIRPYSISMFDSLQFSTDITNELSWKNIGLNDDMPFMLAGSDNYVTQDEHTTPQLTGSSEPFSPGTVMVSDSTINGTQVPSPGRTEHEWVIMGTNHLVPNTTYYFRQNHRYTLFYVKSSGMSYNSYPSLTTTATLAIQLNNFVVTNEGKTIKLQWSASPDEKEAYTNIQRSTDQQVWVIINRISSSGDNYTEYDNNPPAGSTLYYRLQQYDKDGSYSFSAIKSVKTFPSGKAVVSVIPNPASAVINFKVDNTDVKKITAALTDMSGRILLAQTFKNLQAGILNRLSLPQKILPGVYILKLTADGFSESIKVAVQ